MDKTKANIHSRQQLLGSGAWTSPAVFSSDGRRLATQGKELRLYVATWETPRPVGEVTRLDLVSRETQRAPFFVAVTFE